MSFTRPNRNFLFVPLLTEFSLNKCFDAFIFLTHRQFSRNRIHVEKLWTAQKQWECMEQGSLLALVKKFNWLFCAKMIHYLATRLKTLNFPSTTLLIQGTIKRILLILSSSILVWTQRIILEKNSAKCLFKNDVLNAQPLKSVTRELSISSVGCIRFIDFTFLQAIGIFNCFYLWQIESILLLIDEKAMELSHWLQNIFFYFWI